MEPTEQDVAYLKANPTVADKFDARFGEGASSQYLQPTPIPEAVTEPVEVPPEVTTTEPTEEPSSFSAALSRRPGFRSVEEAQGQDVLGRVGDVVSGLGSAVGNGLEEAVNETGNFLGEIVSTAAAARAATVPGATADTYKEVKEVAEEMTDPTDIDVFNEPVTSLGRFTSTTVQFMAGFLGAGKVTGLKGLVGGLVNGGISDGAVMSPDNPNLSSFLAANEYGPEWITTALANDPDDPEWLNRMRNVTEGAALGGTLELTLLGFRAIAKGGRAAEMPPGPERDAAVREAEDLAEEVSEIAEETMRNGAPPPDAPPKFKTVQEMIEEAQARREGREVVPMRDRMTATPPKAPDLPDAPRAPEAPAALVDDEVLKAIIRSPEPVTPTQLANSDWFNASRMSGPVEAREMIEIAGQALTRSGAMDRLGITPQSLEGIRKEATEELASMVGVGNNQLVRRLSDIAESSVDQTRFLVAGKMALQSLGKETAALANRLNDMYAVGKVDPEVEAQLLNMMTTHADVQGYVKSIQTNAARATAAGRIRTGDALSGPEVAALRRVEAVGGSDQIKKLARRVRMAGGPNQLARVIRDSSKKGLIHKGWDVVNEVFINGILSGYPTHLVNMASNSINVAYLPLERMMGGALTRNADQVRAAATQYTQLRSATVDSVRLMGRVLRTESPILDTQIKIDIASQGQKAITRENMGTSNPVAGALIDGVGKFIRVPGRLLMAEDEFFKQITFRSRLSADLSVAARNISDDELKSLGYSSRGEFVQGEIEAATLSVQRVDDLFDDLVAKGRAEDTPEARAAFVKANEGTANEGSKYAQDALRAAREATFTTPLQSGTLSANYQNMVNRHPYLRQITPFIQTPVNILNKAFDRVPGVNVMRSRYRDRLRSENPAVRAEAAGEMATGVAISTALYFLALEGRITGGGPVDGGVREGWVRDKGWQPYSLNIGTTENPEWIEYRRMDPYAFSLGIAGDIAEMIQASQDDPSFDGAGAFALLVASMGNNLVNKTWLQGISETVEVLSSKDRPYVAQRWLENRVASFVPYSSAFRSYNQTVTEDMREARGYADRIKANLPGMSDDLPVRYDWISGESIENPTRLLGFLRTSKGEGNKLDTEIRRLNYDFTGPDRRIGQITLSTEQYQEWNRLMGTIKAPSMGTLSDALNSVMRTPTYDLARQRIPDGVTTPRESHRVKAFTRIMTMYKQASRRALFEKYPELYEAWRAAEEFEDLSRAGVPQEGVRENLITRF